jgi:surface protein
MATPPENDDANNSNAPLNFRHSNSLITTKVPHYPTKLTTGMSIIPGWNRPNANGQNANINDKDYNGPNFKARPLKHWRKQLQVYNYNGPANNSRTATISDLDRPGTTVYHFTPDCTCVSEEGGNSYIISNNKFGYETKDDDYSKGVLDVKVQNNGFTVVPYDATTAQINDPTNPAAYKIMTGIYNTNCINCSPQGNIIRSGIAFQSQAFFSYSNDKLETRCQTYEQNISTNKEPGCVYFDAQGIPLWPNDTRNGPQVVAPVNYQPTRLFNKPCLSETIYKPSNVAFAKQGAVSGATRLKKLVSDTTMMNGSSFYSARGAEEANLGRFQGTNISSNYYVKTKPVVDSCRGTTPTPPILSVVDRDSRSITFTWQDFGNSFCNVVYYTVTYYEISILRRLRNIDDSQYFFNSSEGVEGAQSVEGAMDIQDFLDNYNGIEFYNNDNNDNNDNTETMVMGTKNGNVNGDTVYTDRDNNIEYNIISAIRRRDIAPSKTNPPNIRNISEITELTPNTYVLMSMTSTNGNGTSIRSGVVLNQTLPLSNIVISIEPLTVELNGDNYVYPYNAYEPIVLTVKLSSLHTFTPIILNIINATNPNVATIIPVEGSLDTYQVRLNNAGTFNLEATQAKARDTFGTSEKRSPLLTITQNTPIFSTPWNISRSNVLLIGILTVRTYPFFPLRFLSPSSLQLDGEYKIINIDGTTSNIATFINIDNVESNTANFGDNFGENGIKIKINSYGIFRIRATSIETQNYRSISTTSGNIYASRNDPIIEFEFPNAESFSRKFTYRTGQTYDIAEINTARIISPEGPQSDVRITYSAISLETDTITPSDVASIDARTVTILNAGSFRIRAQTNQTAVYSSVEAISPPITISKATPTFSEPWYLFEDINTVLFKGRTYSFNPPVFTFPYPGPSFLSDAISITSYKSSSDTIARLIGSTTTIEIVGEGPFTITAITTGSPNYNQVEITSREEVSTQNTARVAFPSNFQTSITYGEEYVLNEPQFIYPRDTFSFEGVASLSGSRIVVSIEQYNYFIIGRRVTADITGTTSPPISNINDTITDKKIEYDISTGVSRHVIYIRNDTGISASTPATIRNIIQTISDPRDFFITYSIVSATGTSSDVARISGTTVTLLKAGTFKIRAHTNQISPSPAPTILNSTRDSPPITVQKATPVLRLNDLFPYTLQVGNTYSFNRAVINRPVNIPPEILPITYISLNPDVITIVNGQPTGSERPSLRVNHIGSFRIRAETKPSERYNIGYVESPEEFSTNPGMPLIKFDPSQNFGVFTYRETSSFNINEVIFRNPIERHEEIEVSYYIPETNIVSLQDRTVTINSAGDFTLRVKTIPTANFTTSNILYKSITIKRYTPQFQEGWVAFINTRNVNYVFVGQTFEINPPTLISPNPNEETFPSELRSIQYRIEPERRAEISIISETSTVVKVLEEGAFYIHATTTENSSNYNIGVAPSRRIYGSTPERPIIEFPRNNEVTEITYGDDFSLEEAVFAYPEPIINIEGTATLSMTSTETRIILENLQQYNAIIIGAYLRVTTTSSNIVNFIVVSRMIQTGSFIVVVERHSGETLDIGNYTIQNITQEMRIPVGGSIAYSVVPSPYPPVATISGTNVTINRAGSFTVQAVATITNDPPTFRYSSYPTFSTINVKRATPTLVFEDNNLFPDQVLFTGRRYNFTPAIVTIPRPNSVIYEKLEIEYRSEPSGVVTIFQRDISSNTIPIRVNRAVPFKIIAQTIEPLSGNFNRSAAIYSSNIYGAQENTPVLFFPGENENGEVPVTNLTYGFTNSTGNTNIYNVERPADFRYPYINDIPRDLTINYRINVESSNIARVEMKEIIVDSDNPETIAIFAPVITILRAGEFTLIAETNAGKFTLIGGTVPTVEFRASQPIYRKFNVLKATATFVPWYLFPDDPDNPLLAGQRRTFNPPVFITPNPIPSQMNPSNFTYESSASLIASVETSIVNGARVLTAVINRIGQFQIVASIPETDNYNAIRVYSENEYPTSINRPIIRFPRQPPPTKVITYGDTYTIVPAYFYYPRLSIVQSSGLYITHSIRNSGDFRVLPGTSPDYIQTVQILSAGTFRIYAETNPVENVFEKTYIYLNVTVNRATPTITFPGTIFPGVSVLIVGTSYDFLPAVVTVPSGVTDMIPQVRYRTNDASVATITTVLTPEGERRRINILRPSTTPITITAYTEATINFTATEAVYSNQRSVYYNTPVISAPSINNIINNTLTFGQQPQPTFQLAVVTNPAPNSSFHNGISNNIVYAIVHETENNTLINDIATISGTTITLLMSGRFRIRATTVATSIFRSVSTFTTVVSVNRATPTFLEPWNPIPDVLFVGDVATIIAPQITLPIPAHMDEIFPITYSYYSTSRGIITITPLNTIAIRNFGNTGSLTTTTMMQLSSGGNGDVLLGELFPTLVSPNNVVNTIRVTIPNGISVVPYLYENVSAYGQNPSGAGLNRVRNCSVYSPSEVGTSIIPDNFLFFSLFGLQSSFTYNDMIITPANTNACGVGTNPILHYIDLWLPANRTLTSTIEIFEGSNLVPSSTYRRDNITTGGATITVAGQPMLPVRIYASDIVSAQGVSQNYIRPFNNGTLQFRIRITVIINGFPRILPTRQQFPNMPIMTVNMSSTDNIISNNSGITSQITTNFTDITITNNTSYRFGFLPLGITNRNQAWIQIGTINILGGTLTQYTCSLENIASSVTINNIGRFKLTATTTKSVRYNAITIPSPMETATTRRRPVIVFPISFQTRRIFGETYNFFQPTFDVPPGTPHPAENGVTITYTIENPSRADVPVATASGTSGQTITINNVGYFYIRATTNATNLFDSVTHPLSPRVTVIAATPTFPPTAWNALPTAPATVFVGDTVTITPPPPLTLFTSLALQQLNGISIVYIIGGTETITGTTFTRTFAGTFDIRAETRSNGNYNNARIDSTHTMRFINRPPPRIVIHNVETLVFQETSLPRSPDFIEANPRGPLEWFAVVDQRSFQQIRNYATERAEGRVGAGATVFMRIPGNTSTLIPFNNIVTTLMTNMNSLFSGIQNFNENIASWDTSRVTNMNFMFNGCNFFNQRLERWNTAEVTSMNSMFAGAQTFSQNIGNWNTSRVEDMGSMFINARNFDNGGFQNMNNWNTGRVRNMGFMFLGASRFNQPIGRWNTSAVTIMASMFQQAHEFNQDLWFSTINVINMALMFNGALRFNGWVRDFDTRNVITMNAMFGSATSFNQQIGRWNTSLVVNMSQIFDGATSFNQPIRYWNTGAVTDMSFMFRNAQQFNQMLDLWSSHISRVRYMQHMFEGAITFNNGDWPPVTFFNGFMTQAEVSLEFNLQIMAPATVANNPRRRMDWQVMNVINMNHMFDGARSFINTDISRWDVRVRTIGFRRNCPLSDIFTPFSIRLGFMGGR